ncbi:CBASS oligonucleotide cyclase [Brevibacillus invocatus]|uniref:CBASS oligonucleotide cyclase n=1 Tax=Brevibacillus invocatus TaxID=173959 RepID=UPI002040F282|nr:CBASS oligonucleotide cyclase [Brevibacillus invocatus]MCM3081690.1 nucleotidyltransferase [Brevibacillus invocatus]MCM3432098.1 nucleotidyltransferase [Brevibacillus invocatus]
MSRGGKRMGGSGGGYSVPGKTLGELEKERAAREENEKFETELNKYIKELLKGINDRDVEGINRHLETLRNALEKDIEGYVELRFGGSIMKKTYADGLSDVDMLVQINNSDLAGAKPNEVLKFFSDQIKRRLPNTEVKIGKLGVTVKFTSGHEIQLLPSVKTETGYRIARPGENSWSNVIKPNKFAEKLTTVNQANTNKVVPLIKLMKKINAGLPPNKQLSGYHIESLAIDAFKNATSVPKTYKGMVEHFCRHAEKAVLRPITDSTGQSVHADSHLGVVNSVERQRVSATFKQIIKRIETANNTNSLASWKSILESE